MQRRSLCWIPTTGRTPSYGPAAARNSSTCVSLTVEFARVYYSELSLSGIRTHTIPFAIQLVKLNCITFVLLFSLLESVFDQD